MTSTPAGDGLAKVTYLPWARPDADDAAEADETSSADETAARRGDDHPSRGRSGRAWRRRAVDDAGNGADADGGWTVPGVDRATPPADPSSLGGGRSGIRGLVVDATRDRTDDADGDDDGDDPDADDGRPGRAGGRGAGRGSDGRARAPRPLRAGSDRARQRAENVSIAALTRRGLSSVELSRVLVERGIDPADADREVERLAAVGLVDDARLAAQLVTGLRERKGLGARAIGAELRRRGLADETVTEALAELDDDDLEAALRVARPRARSLVSLPRDVAERRLAAFLMRKGYGGSIIGRVVREVLGSSSTGRTSTVRFEESE